MKTLKGWITTSFLVGALLFGNVNAEAGIIFAGLNQNTPPCSDQPTVKDAKDDLGGIIFTGLTGIIFAGFTGIIFTGGAAEGPVDCGIIFGGN